MRIIAGRFRGVRLAEVGQGDPRAQLRPTSDRVRESLFSMLSHRDALVGASVLDLFAGTGALGLEALSRGAKYACFVENGRAGQRLVGENIKKLRVSEETQVLRQDATRLAPNAQEPFDLLFLDPPYGRGLGELALSSAAVGGWLAPQATVVWEEKDAMVAPDGFARLDTRRYGDTHVTLLEAP